MALRDLQIAATPAAPYPDRAATGTIRLMGTARRMQRLIGVFLLILAPIGCGRTGSYRANIHSDDVNERILAIREAAQKDDKTAVPLLVDRLDDEDDAVRFFAILALDKITGHRFGYDYAEPARQRAEAVERWRAYLKDPERVLSMEKQRPRSSGGPSHSAAAGD
jgi:hypothetical protein